MNKNDNRVKYACYTANVCMSLAAMLSPILFITLRTTYGLSYTLLGLLVLINFCTQLIVDLIFSFFSHKLDVEKSVKSIPAVGALGFAIYALFPVFFPNYAYIGLVLGTITFSAASGIAEVLISPVVAALPSENSERELSFLHSTYAWGIVFLSIISTVFFLVFGTQNWYLLVLFFLVIPLSSLYLFKGTTFPKIHTPEKSSGAFKILLNKSMLFCLLCIFLGGASEVIMSQWSAGYIEQSLNLSKFWSDVLGIAFFALMLGLGRTLYAHFGKNISRVLFFGAIGATICYAAAIFITIPVICALACALTGFCVSMMWPGSLIIVNDKVPNGGVAVFAFMAAGGDLGASVGHNLLALLQTLHLKTNL